MALRLCTGRTACTEPQCLYKGALYLYLYEGYMFRPVYSATLRTYVIIFPQNAIVGQHLIYDHKV